MTIDKHDEALDALRKIAIEANKEGTRLALLKIEATLRSSFPPPAEDARQLVKSIRKGGFAGAPSGGFNVFDLKDDEAAAQISRFAESRVEPWREMVDEILNYCIANRGRDDAFYRCNTSGKFPEWVYSAEALLSDSPAKETAK